MNTLKTTIHSFFILIAFIGFVAIAYADHTTLGFPECDPANSQTPAGQSACSSKIRQHCNSVGGPAVDPQCASGGNSYENHLRQQNNLNQVEVPISVSICADNDSILSGASCGVEIAQYCNTQPDPATCQQNLTQAVEQRIETRARLNETSSGVPDDFNETADPNADRAWTGQIRNPLAVNSIEGLVTAILSQLIIISIPLIVMAIIFAGFMYVTARGNAEQIKKATTALTYAVIGGMLILLAVTITEILESSLSEFLR